MLVTRKVGGEDSAFSYVRLKYGENATDTVSGVIIYPDDFSFSEVGVASMKFGKDYLTQINAADWEALENAGCVFLPGAYMIRYSTTDQIEMRENNIGLYLGYWSATTQSAAKASRIDVAFVDKGMNTNNYNGICERYLLFPVRLAQDL